MNHEPRTTRVAYTRIGEIVKARSHAWHAATSARGRGDRLQWRMTAHDLDRQLLEAMAELPRTEYKHPLVIIVPGVGARFLRCVKRRQAFYTTYEHSRCLDVEMQEEQLIERLAEEADVLNIDDKQVFKKLVEEIEMAELREVEERPVFLEDYEIPVELPEEDESLEDFLARTATL